MGWDNDRNGDYVPRPPPLWSGIVAGLALAIFFALVIFSDGQVYGRGQGVLKRITPCWKLITRS